MTEQDMAKIISNLAQKSSENNTYQPLSPLLIYSPQKPSQQNPDI